MTCDSKSGEVGAAICHTEIKNVVPTILVLVCDNEVIIVVVCHHCRSDTVDEVSIHVVEVLETVEVGVCPAAYLPSLAADSNFGIVKDLRSSVGLTLYTPLNLTGNSCSSFDNVDLVSVSVVLVEPRSIV